jgi:molybdopterin converting factor subunit 1
MAADSIAVRVLLFARARELVGARSVSLTLPFSSTVADLRAALTTLHPALAALLTCSALAVNHAFADDSTPLSPDDEIALIPPVSGG